ncbi:MAG TPA: dihydropteroate synthase [Gemmatimonadales bacterium]
MNVTALDRTTPGAFQMALTRRGLDPVRAAAVMRGVKPMAFVLDGVDEVARERIVQAAQQRHLECLTGDGWAVLAGGVAELAGLTRTGRSLLPEELADALGRSLSAVWGDPAEWSMARGTISLVDPVIVGIVNVTPDSFSDGGRFLEPVAAVAHAGVLIAEGASVLDVGAESTRPGVTAPVSADEEWRRLEPVLDAIRARHPAMPITVDTMRGQTARRALKRGAWAINDVSGLRYDTSVADACAEFDAGLILMHSRGIRSTMATYEHAHYEDLVSEMLHEMEMASGRATAAGVREERIVLDPGLGFAKTPEQSVLALQSVGAMVALGRPVMLGPSRKRFLGALTGRDVEDRDVATAVACAAGFALGARLFRVHAPGPTRDALAVARAVWGA